MTMPEIKPCPFCGKDAQIAPDEIGSGGQHVPPYHAGCLRGAGCGIAFTADDPDEAIAEWNRCALSTVTPAEVSDLVDRLREGTFGSDITKTDAYLNGLMREAATALAAKDAELAAVLETVFDLINAAGLEAHEAGDEPGEQALAALQTAMRAEIARRALEAQGGER